MLRADRKKKKNGKEEIMTIQTGNYSNQVYNGDFRDKGKETYLARFKCTYFSSKSDDQSK